MEWLVPPVEATLHTWEDLLVGQDPLQVAALTDDITNRLPWKGGPELGTTVAAVNMAIHDHARASRDAAHFLDQVRREPLVHGDLWSPLRPQRFFRQRNRRAPYQPTNEPIGVLANSFTLCFAVGRADVSRTLRARESRADALT